mmetsp:Transcript_54796/g.107200  ORF Transcript_54796/g.107200 Transcript_54796/m.107200 type:complete len:145 (+) Transcript_54796:297-731(+)
MMRRESRSLCLSLPHPPLLQTTHHNLEKEKQLPPEIEVANSQYRWTTGLFTDPPPRLLLLILSKRTSKRSQRHPMPSPIPKFHPARPTSLTAFKRAHLHWQHFKKMWRKRKQPRRRTVRSLQSSRLPITILLFQSEEGEKEREG